MTKQSNVHKQSSMRPSAQKAFKRQGRTRRESLLNLGKVPIKTKQQLETFWTYLKEYQITATAVIGIVIIAMIRYFYSASTPKTAKLNDIPLPPTKKKKHTPNEPRQKIIIPSSTHPSPPTEPSPATSPTPKPQPTTLPTPYIVPNTPAKQPMLPMTAPQQASKKSTPWMIGAILLMLLLLLGFYQFRKKA